MAGRLVRNTSLVFVGHAVTLASKGLLVLLMTRYLLRPTEYGLLFLTISVLGVAMLFANLGFAKAGARYVTEYRTAAPELVGVVVRSTLRYNAVAIATICAIVLVLREQIAAAVGQPAIAVLLLFGVGYVVFKSLQATSVTLFQGFDMMGWVAITEIVTHVLTLVAIPTLLVAGFGLGGVLSGYSLGYAVAAGVALVVIFRRLDDGHDVGAERADEVSARVLRYSAPLTLARGANTMDSRADTILLGLFRGPTSVAFYTLGKQVADFLIAPAQALGFAISPAYGEEKADGDLSRAADLYERTFVYTVALYGPAAVGVMAVANPAVSLVFGADYAGAGPILQIFSVFVFVRVIDKITNDALDFLGRARSRAVAKGSRSVANIVLNLSLIPPFGAVGATVATVATYSVLVAVELYVIADELPIDTSRLLRASLVVGGIAVGMSAVVYPLAGSISDLPSLAGVIVVGALVWFVLTTASGLVDLRAASLT